MGAETDAWLAANANLVNHLAVTGTADAPVVFETALDADHPHALTYLTIDAAAGSSLTVVQVVRGDAEGGISANLTRIRAAEGAHVVLVQVQLLGNNARRWNAVAIEQGTSARVEQVRIELGGSWLIVEPSPDGGRWPRPRPRPDEGRVCHDCPLMGRCRRLCPHQSASRTASPEGEALALSLR